MKAKLVKSAHGDLKTIYETHYEGVVMWFDKTELEAAAMRFVNLVGQEC